jgi:surface antigen
LAFSRYVTHLVVLTLVIVMSGVTLLPAVHLQLGVVNAAGLINETGGSVGGVELGRLGTIVNPVAVPRTPQVSHTAITYQVKDGDNLSAIAARHNVAVDDIRWSNYSSLKNTAKDVTKGQTILIPPVSGMVVTTQPGDTPQSLAQTYHAASNTIVDFNYLRTGDADPLLPNTQIVIPGGHGPDFERPASATRTALVSGLRGDGSYTLGSFNGTWSVAPNNRFTYGNCTWYVYNRRQVPWLGDAWQWFGQAQNYGWKTGQTPRPGAIMVTWESSFGHVAYVESVGPGAAWTVSEMNFRAFATVDTRTISGPNAVPLIGFIYGP